MSFYRNLGNYFVWAKLITYVLVFWKTCFSFFLEKIIHRFCTFLKITAGWNKLRNWNNLINSNPVAPIGTGGGEDTATSSAPPPHPLQFRKKVSKIVPKIKSFWNFVRTKIKAFAPKIFSFATFLNLIMIYYFKDYPNLIHFSIFLHW